jgi:hypothetical protein
MVYITMTNKDPDHLDLDVEVADNDASDPYVPPFTLKYGDGPYRVDLSDYTKTINYTVRADGRQPNVKKDFAVTNATNYDLAAGPPYANRDGKPA